MTGRFLMSFFVAATLLAGSPVHAKSASPEVSIVDSLGMAALRSPVPRGGSHREKLVESTLSEDAEVRTRAYLYLSSLEMEAANFEAARGWLELYHTEALAVFRAKQ